MGHPRGSRTHLRRVRDPAQLGRAREAGPRSASPTCELGCLLGSLFADEFVFDPLSLILTRFCFCLISLIGFIKTHPFPAQNLPRLHCSSREETQASVPRSPGRGYWASACPGPPQPTLLARPLPGRGCQPLSCQPVLSSTPPLDCDWWGTCLPGPQNPVQAWALAHLRAAVNRSPSKA